jgi:hypothetical protein
MKMSLVGAIPQGFLYTLNRGDTVAVQTQAPLPLARLQ